MADASGPSVPAPNSAGDSTWMFAWKVRDATFWRQIPCPFQQEIDECAAALVVESEECEGAGTQGK